MKAGLDPALSRLLSDQQAHALTRWCELNRRGIRLASHDLLRGHTDSWLALVYVSGTRRPRKCLVKIDPATHFEATEAGRHTDALASSPSDFVQAHLVHQIWDPVMLDDRTSLMFFDVANGDLTAVSTLTRLFGSRILPAALGTVVRGVLEGWNPDDTDLTPTSVSGLLREHLQSGLNDDGPVGRWLGKQPGLWEAIQLGRSDGGLPNPLALLDGRLGHRVVVQKHVGRAHGDLHLGNVLVPDRPTGNDLRRFRLVDLSAFQSDAPLARDPMFLLASAALLYLPEMGTRSRWAAITALVDHKIQDPGLVPVDLLDCADQVWKAGLDWAHDASLAPEWRAESLLSLVSAGLRHIEFCEKAEDKWWFFVLASYAAAAFLAETSESMDGMDLAGPVYRMSTLAIGPAETLPAPARGTPRLAMADLRILVDTIMRIEALREPDAWKHIADQLPVDLVYAQPVTADLREHVALVVTQLNRQRGLEPWRRLLQAVAEAVPGESTLARAMVQVGLGDTVPE